MQDDLPDLVPSGSVEGIYSPGHGCCLDELGRAPMIVSIFMNNGDL
jgi:hypothetical protein